jgi:hypothetical protein
VTSALTAALTPAHAEPPDEPALSCHVTAQQVDNGMRLAVQFTNSSDRELALAPGPHLVWYHDASAQDPMDRTVRANRVQNAPLRVPAQASRSALWAFSAEQVDDLRCNAALPAAAALYFYQFNRRPRFRCLLQGYALDAVSPVSPVSACPPAALRP